MTIFGHYTDPIYIVLWVLVALFILMAVFTAIMLSIRKELRGIHDETRKTSNNTNPNLPAFFHVEPDQSRRLELHSGSASQSDTEPINSLDIRQSLQYGRPESAGVPASSDIDTEQTALRLRSISSEPRTEPSDPTIEFHST